LMGLASMLTSDLAGSCCSNIFTRPCSLSIFQLTFPLFWLYFQGDFFPMVAKKSTCNLGLHFTRSLIPTKKEHYKSQQRIFNWDLYESRMSYVFSEYHQNQRETVPLLTGPRP
jgi:hypothetical protein